MVMIVEHRWPGRPRPLPDETLSSWFVRVAAANGLTAAELYRLMIPHTQRSGGDLDCLASIEFVRTLAAATGYDEAVVVATTTAEWVDRVYERDNLVRKTYWLPPVGLERGRPSYGQQICPMCLAEDEVPYFRRHWRLHFVVACERHRIYLSDRCLGCGKAIRPLKVNRVGRRLTCPECGCSLARQEGSPASGFGYQRRLLDIAARGTVDEPGLQGVSSADWFKLLRVSFRLLAGGRIATKLRRFAVGRDERFLPLLELPLTTNIDAIAPHERHVLVMAAIWFLESWPSRFVTCCQVAGISQLQLDGICRFNVHASSFTSVNRKSP